MEMHFNELEDNRLFIGTDLNGTLYYLEMPDIFFWCSPCLKTGGSARQS